MKSKSTTISATLAVAVASAFAVTIAGPAVSASTVQSPAANGNTQQVTTADTFTSINHSGEVVLSSANGDEYALSGCKAIVSDHSVELTNCTGSGDAGFFDGQTPTQALLTGVARDTQSHAGTLTISGVGASGSSTVLKTLTFPAPLAGGPTGCVFLPDSTTSAYSCTGSAGR